VGCEIIEQNKNQLRGGMKKIERTKGIRTFFRLNVDKPNQIGGNGEALQKGRHLYTSKMSTRLHPEIMVGEGGTQPRKPKNM